MKLFHRDASTPSGTMPGFEAFEEGRYEREVEQGSRCIVDLASASDGCDRVEELVGLLRGIADECEARRGDGWEMEGRIVDGRIHFVRVERESDTS